MNGMNSVAWSIGLRGRLGVPRRRQNIHRCPAPVRAPALPISSISSAAPTGKDVKQTELVLRCVWRNKADGELHSTTPWSVGLSGT